MFKVLSELVGKKIEVRCDGHTYKGTLQRTEANQPVYLIGDAGWHLWIERSHVTAVAEVRGVSP